MEGARVRIRVQDTGPPDNSRLTGPPNEEGHGLAYMRERAALYGGTVDAGPVPRPGRGWAVQATLDLTPLPGSEGGTP